MSVSAFITWTIQKKDTQISWVKIVQYLLAKGWNLNDNGMMSYLPLHDNGRFDWNNAPINKDKLINILTEKEKAKESLGVSITWKNTNIGGSLLTLNDVEILFSITINRQTISLYDGESITDVNWYLSRINSILSEIKGLNIISTNFIEHV